ncbi:MAG: Ig-like domain-containing protein [Prevotellaceae bacterium]|jgi:gliding motility-associated-like protein|nr:Ig-like domain-containing protein [Prevotellaceae bacterium]
MKKILTLLILLSVVLTSSFATDLTGIKIYINPGHGGYDSNDRNVVTIPFNLGDTLGFYESKSNLMKGLYLRDLLLAQNATIMMSRTLNRTQDDRALSSIVAEANAFAPDGFLSIHSNANGTADNSTNYLLLLYSGTDAASFYPPTKAYATACWPFLIDNQLKNWSSTTVRIRGDADFYGTGGGPYLGVLNGLVHKAFLSEGSFHDYPPETHRLLNQDYCNLEGYQFSQFFHSFFNADMPNTGVIGGWVKSENEKMSHSRYKFRAGSTDQWKPLNGAIVKLFDASGNTELQSYTTDSLYNGIFAFYNLTPGNYKLKFVAADYNTDTVVDVAVQAGQIAYAKVQLYNNNIPVSHDHVDDYPEPAQSGAVALGNYKFTEISNAQPAWLTDGTTIKRAIHRNDKIYVLTTEPKIYVIDALTYALIKELDMTGISGGTHSILSDIAFTADNYLMACNKETVSLPAGAYYFKVYSWDSDAAAPVLWFQSQKNGNWSNGIVGETFTVSGPRWHFFAYTTARTTASSGQIRIVGFDCEIHDSINIVGEKYMGGNAGDNGIYSESVWGTNPIFTISPSGNSDHFYIDSDIMLPHEYQFDWSKAEREALTLKAAFAETSNYKIGAKPSGLNVFRYAHHIFMAMPVCDTTTAANVGVALFDITNGIDQAVKISEKYPSAGLGTTPATYMAAGSKVVDYDIELIIWAKNQGIARYKTIPSELANIYASELAITANNEFKFTLNENAQSVDIKLYDYNFINVATFNLGALNKGVHVIAEDFSALPNDTYTWSVTATAAGVDRPSLITDNSSQFQFYSPRGVAVDNSFDSPFFGRIYISEGTGGPCAGGGRTTQTGVYILNAAFADTTNQQTASYTGGVAWLAGSGTGYQYGPSRLNVAEDGNVYIPDSHYANSGVWIMNPANPSAAFTPVFGGTRNTATGEVSNSGTVIHNPVQGAYVLGSGTSTQLFTLDRPSSPVSASINRYDIGDLSGLPWVSAPSQIINLTGFANAYGGIAYDNNGGWFASQYRGQADGYPTLVHVNDQGVTDYTAVTDLLENGDRRIPMCPQGGMGVSTDGALLAIVTGPSKVEVFDVTYSPQGAPTLANKYILNTGGLSDNILSIAFDAAGNVYTVSNSNERLRVFSLPKADNSFTTPAPTGSVLVVNNTPIDEANIYASELAVSTIDEIDYTFKYTLNAKASSLVIHIIDENDQIVKDIPITAAVNRSLGVHEFTTTISDLPLGTYKWSITAKGVYRSNSATDPTKVSNDDPQFKFSDSRSIAVDNTFDSPFFGRVYISDAQGTGAGSTGEGIFILNAALSDTTNQNGNGYKGNVAWLTTSSPFRASVAPDGKVYITDWSDAHSGIWVMDPANPTTAFTPVFGGTRDGLGLSSSGGVNIHGSISHCWITGTGADTKLFTIDEDYTDAIATDKINILQYNIGVLENPWTVAPSAIAYNDVQYGNLQQNGNSCIVPDTFGGWWISQNRGAGVNTTAIPSLIHVNSQGTLTNFGGNPDIPNSNQSGLAISIDGTMIAVGCQNTVRVFDVVYDVNNMPAITLKYTINTTTFGTNTHGLAFDRVNNLYVASSANSTAVATRVGVFAFPIADNTFTTPAPYNSSIVITSLDKPVVENTVPANGATDISVNLNSISITFSHEMNTSVDGVVQVVNTQTSVATGSVSSPQWSADNKTVTFNYSGQLDYATNYTIKISDFKNSSNVMMDEDANNSFTTSELPTVVSTTPANGATNVSVYLNSISVTFSKAMNQSAAGSLAIKTGGVSVGTISAPQWYADSKTVTYTFTGSLDYSTNYTLEIAGFFDNAGNEITETVYNFTTEQKIIVLYINKDNATWINHEKTFTLRQNGEIKYTGNDNLDGSVAFVNVKDGMYRLYDGTTDLKDQVVYGTAGFGLSYFTILYGLQNSGKANGSVINATYNDNVIASGDIVVSGKKLVLTAVGNGASDYTYIWRGTWKGNANINITDNMLVNDNLDNIVDVHCTITGLGDEVILPKVLTPNADGENDFFYVHGLEVYQSNDLRIFNRAGTEVFRAKNYKNNTWNGSDLPDDVYFIRLSLTDANGAISTKTGYVHLKK